MLCLRLYFILIYICYTCFWQAKTLLKRRIAMLYQVFCHIPMLLWTYHNARELVAWKESLSLTLSLSLNISLSLSLPPLSVFFLLFFYSLLLSPAPFLLSVLKPLNTFASRPLPICPSRFLLPVHKSSPLRQ